MEVGDDQDRLLPRWVRAPLTPIVARLQCRHSIALCTYGQQRHIISPLKGRARVGRRWDRRQDSTPALCVFECWLVVEETLEKAHGGRRPRGDPRPSGRARV